MRFVTKLLLCLVCAPLAHAASVSNDGFHRTSSSEGGSIAHHVYPGVVDIPTPASGASYGTVGGAGFTKFSDGSYVGTSLYTLDTLPTLVDDAALLHAWDASFNTWNDQDPTPIHMTPTPSGGNVPTIVATTVAIHNPGDPLDGTKYLYKFDGSGGCATSASAWILPAGNAGAGVSVLAEFRIDNTEGVLNGNGGYLLRGNNAFNNFLIGKNALADGNVLIRNTVETWGVGPAGTRSGGLTAINRGEFHSFIMSSDSAGGYVLLDGSQIDSYTGNDYFNAWASHANSMAWCDATGGPNFKGYIAYMYVLSRYMEPEEAKAYFLVGPRGSDAPLNPYERRWAMRDHGIVSDDTDNSGTNYVQLVAEPLGPGVLLMGDSNLHPGITDDNGGTYSPPIDSILRSALEQRGYDVVNISFTSTKPADYNSGSRYDNILAYVQNDREKPFDLCVYNLGYNLAAADPAVAVATYVADVTTWLSLYTDVGANQICKKVVMPGLNSLYKSNTPPTGGDAAVWTAVKDLETARIAFIAAHSDLVTDGGTAHQAASPNVDGDLLMWTLDVVDANIHWNSRGAQKVADPLIAVIRALCEPDGCPD